MWTGKGQPSRIKQMMNFYFAHNKFTKVLQLYRIQSSTRPPINAFNSTKAKFDDFTVFVFPRDLKVSTRVAVTKN